MRNDRLWVRALKLLILLGATSLLVEALFEFRLLAGPFTDSPSVPGESKIIEHFVIQHIAFPLIGLLLVLNPRSLSRLVASRLATAILATLAVLVTIPEVIVSQTDLFRPYPFDLKAEALRQIQMIEVFGQPVNLLQLQHLVCSHLALMGSIATMAIAGPSVIRAFSGPRTGETTADSPALAP